MHSSKILKWVQKYLFDMLTFERKQRMIVQVKRVSLYQVGPILHHSYDKVHKPSQSTSLPTSGSGYEVVAKVVPFWKYNVQGLPNFVLIGDDVWIESVSDAIKKEGGIYI